jgi:cell division protein FtsL
MNRIFDHRVRGFRVVEVISLTLLVAMVFAVYMSKTLAGRERAEIASIDRQIAQQERRIRLLKAEVAHLEQPERLGRLSADYLGLAPVDAKRQAPAESLEEIARTRAEAPKPLAAKVVP